jgi:predicted ribosomally synthesized peptide with SipW-like signal peptide
MQDSRLELSRRKILAGLGSIGVASAGAGLGTTAYFSDQETYKGNQLVAGELDLMVDWQEHYSDWSDDEEDAAPSAHMVDGLDDVGEDEIGLPILDEPMLAMAAEDLNAFMDATAVEAFPDDDDDGIQDMIWTRDQIQSDPSLVGLPPTASDEKIEQAYRDQFAQVPDDLERPVIELQDVKPGDFGEVTFSVHLFDNPGYIWMNGALLANEEVSVTEPEAKDPDEPSSVAMNESEYAESLEGPDVYGELADAIQVAIWHDDGDNLQDQSETVVMPHSEGSSVNISIEKETALVFRGTLREAMEVLSVGNGLPLDSDPRDSERQCYPNSTTRHLAFAWWLPVDHANELQTDRVKFDLGFYTEQCRHNDGSGQEITELGGTAAKNTGFEAVDGSGFVGSGYWSDDPNQTNQDGGDYEQLYITFEETYGPYYLDSLATFTVGEIETIRYRTRRPQGASQDYFMEIFTFPDGANDDATWYGRQLQALPGNALDKSVNPDTWLTWRTDPGQNQLTFYDYNHDYDTTDSNSPPYLGQDTGVTLSELQSTASFDWSNYVSNADSTPKNYRDEEVRALRFATGSAWEDTHVGDLDAIEIRLDDGREMLVDLES